MTRIAVRGDQDSAYLVLGREPGRRAHAQKLDRCDRKHLVAFQKAHALGIFQQHEVHACSATTGPARRAGLLDGVSKRSTPSLRGPISISAAPVPTSSWPSTPPYTVGETRMASLRASAAQTETGGARKRWPP